ncbi:MAG: hypothetical protein HYU66_00835 [Armatimonadetes bacterium]|nr:hypothetical protein [Armatimonadota bacterium]
MTHRHGSTRRRRAWLIVCAGLAGGGFWADRQGGLTSGLGLLHLLRLTGVVGFLSLGQALVSGPVEVDLGAGATAALATMLAMGLTPVLGLAGAVAAALLAGAVLGAAPAVLGPLLRCRPVFMTLLPVVVVPALLPGEGWQPPLEGLAGFSLGTCGPWVPWLFVAWLAALAGSAAWRAAGFGTAVRNGALAGVGWALLGVWWAGRNGAATAVEVTPALLGWGLALLARRDDGGLDAVLLAALATAAAVLLTAGAELDTGPAAGLLGPAGPLVTAVVMLLGLALRPGSAHPGDRHADGVGPAPVVVTDVDLKLLPGAGGDPAE